MVRSLYAAISGMRNHQVRLDVIGNNIANVNTTGFKAGRVTFEESMAQLLKGASRPPGFKGGTNPLQVGLGMSVGSVDTITTQGNLESTGQITDLAIEGDAYFVVSNGTGNYYSRNGAFQFDSTGRMVLPTNGFLLQGKMAAQDGTFPVGTTVGDITIPFSQQAPAKETANVNYSGNLNSDSEARGTVLYTQAFYHRMDEFNTVGLAASVNDNNFGVATAGVADHAGAALAFADIASDTRVLDATPLTGLHNSNGESLQIKTGDILSVTATIGAETITGNFEVINDSAQAGRVGTSATDFRVNNIQQFLIAAQEFLNGTAWNGGLGPASNANIAIMPDGKVRVQNTGAADISNLTVKSNRPISTTFVGNTFSFNSTIAAVNGYSDTPNGLLRPAVETDNLFDPMYFDAAHVPLAGVNPVAQIFDAKGNEIDLENGDTLNITANVGTTPKSSRSLVVNQGVNLGSSTTMQDLITNIRNTLNLPETDGTVLNNRSVSLNPTGTDDDNIPEGAIVLRGQPEKAFSINNFSMLAENASATTQPPADFNTNMVSTQLQAARDTGVYDTSIEVYDDSGTPHTLTMTFTHTGQKNPATWNWEVQTNNGEEILQGRTGRITFGQDGSPSSFTFDEAGVATVRINPNNGAKVIDINTNWGGPGSFLGITQFAAPTTVAATTQDGYASGNLEQISIDEFGVIQGSFSNGITKALAQILTANFRNAGGLMKKGDSVYQESSNSGSAVLGIPGISSPGVIKPGALELSNVELATEFTNMITTQRGYQANARVITTSDNMLQELVNLVR